MNVVQSGEEGTENTMRERRLLHPNQHKKTTGTSAFASRTQRGQYQVVEAPDPGAYDVVGPSNQENWKRGTGNGLLASGAQRFKQAETDLAFTPGPGQYKINGSLGKLGKGTNRKRVGFVSTEKRFSKKGGETIQTSRAPGPGSYDVDPLYGNFNKRTFNMSIAEQETF